MQIEWSLNAICDLENIKIYIANDSEYYATCFVEGAFNAVKRLSIFPYSGRVVPEIAEECIREIIYGSYRIIYQITDTEVNIVTVIHAMRDFKGL